MRIELVKNSPFLEENGIYDLKESINMSGKIAGECYSKVGLSKLMNEPQENTDKRINLTINNGHHSVYDHNNITMEISDIPKMLAMVLNNEKQYTTLEKSLRYTPVENKNGCITEKEENLYNEWLEIFQKIIKEAYGYYYGDKAIEKLAQENARYLVTVFIPTRMVYTTTLRQYNYLASFMERYINEKKDSKDYFEINLVKAMEEFIAELKRVNILDERLMRNEDNRKLSLFGENIRRTNTIFDETYLITYKTSFAGLAQAHRHRTIDYEMERTEEKEFFVPPILSHDTNLITKWLYDMDSVKEFAPQGELVLVKENGSYKDFLEKCKKRLCSHAQLEIMLNTRETLLRYRDALKVQNHYLAEDIEKYTKGARCTFCDFKCTEDCHFKEGKTLTRKI